MSVTVRVTTHSPEQTIRLGAELGYLLVGGDVLCLSGDLGAGKTALTAGIGKGWGAVEHVNSPTFVFVHEHRRDQDETRLYHLDCYRIADPVDAESIGVEDILDDGSSVAVIEWPERIADLLPAERLWITIEAQDNEQDRLLTFQATGTRYETLLHEFSQSASLGLA